MTTRGIIAVTISLVMLLPIALTPISAAEEMLRLQPLIQEALAVNPEIRAEAKKWDAAKERPPQAGSLDDPMLSFEIENLPTNSFAFTQEDMTMKKLGL
ncbi:MAG: TolC family protein, partial [Candidatus Methylomirabilota bacterium]